VPYSQTILFVAGEISGDMYGAAVAEAIRKAHPEVLIYGVGGDELKRVSHHFLYETAYSSAIGLKGMWQSLTRFNRLQKTLANFCKQVHLDKVVIIDFQHHNFELAAFFQRINVPIITFITPNFWLWKDEKKAKCIAQYSKKIIPIFEKEAEFYKKFHPHVTYFGHPLVDTTKALTIEHNASAAAEKKIISLFPGSRKQELEVVLPLMLKTLSHLPDPAQFDIRLAVSSERFLPLINSILRQYPHLEVRFWEGDKAHWFTHTDILLCASGSATLEAVLYKVPMIIFCTLPTLTYYAAKYILRLKLDHVALPNIIAGSHVVPEWVQNDIRPKQIAEQIIEIASGPPWHWLSVYHPLIQSMTPTPHPVEHIAEEIYSS
jgi:lipid-A-disaccharide synthase